MSRNLGHYLLKQAREAGVHQAVLHPVSAGFLNGAGILWNVGEMPPPSLPQCLELIGEEELLRAYLEVERPYLTNVRALMMRSEQLLDVFDAGRENISAQER